MTGKKVYTEREFANEFAARVGKLAGTGLPLFTKWANERDWPTVLRALDFLGQRTAAGHEVTVNLAILSQCYHSAKPPPTPTASGQTPTKCGYCQGRNWLPVYVVRENDPARVDYHDDHHDGWRLIIQSEAAWPVVRVVLPCGHGADKPMVRRVQMAAMAVANCQLEYALRDECLRLMEARAAANPEQAGRPWPPRDPNPPERGPLADILPTSSKDMMRRAAVALAEPTGESRVLSDEDAPL